MADLDLDELEVTATELNVRGGQTVYMTPKDVLALIGQIRALNERVKRAEAEIAFLKENRLPGLEADAAALEKAEAVITKIRAAEKESTDWRDYGQTVDRILAAYQNGADQ